MNKEKIDNIAEIFKAMSHPTRLMIVCGLIVKNECNVTTMVEKLNLPQPTISQHLNILKHAGIIEGFRDGNQVCYKVVNEDVKTVIKALELCKE